MSTPEPVEPKPYVRPEWVKRYLKRNGYLLDEPIYLESEGAWLSVLGLLGWLIMLGWMGLSFFTSSSDVGIIERLGGGLFLTVFAVVTVPYIGYLNYDNQNTDNKLVALIYRYSKYGLNTWGLLTGVALAVVGYFWITNRWEAQSDIDQLKGIGVGIIVMLGYLAYAVAQRNRE